MLDAERKRSAIAQEQLAARGDASPLPSEASAESLAGSLWAAPDDAPAGALLCVEDALAQLTRRDGELRALALDAQQLRHERDKARALLAAAHKDLDDYRAVQEQYDALLQMYGEKEEQLAEVRLDLQDVTQLYKQQLDDLIALKQRARR